MAERELTKLRRRRGVAKGSITRIETRLAELEGNSSRPNVHDSARQMLAQLKEHDTDFKRTHLTLIDLIEDEDALFDEQATLDDHDDQVASLTVRILALTDVTNPTTREVSAREVLTRRCDRLESRFTETNTALTSLTHEDVCRVQQYQEQLLDFKKEIAEISNSLLSLTIGESDTLPTRVSSLEKKLFDCSLRLKELSRSSTTPTLPVHSEPRGVKLPKLDVPQFSGNILHWVSFWEQFCISVHERPSLSDAEKFVYLQQALRGGSARTAIDGLSQSGENYAEAVECLKSRYNRPRLILVSPWNHANPCNHSCSGDSPLSDCIGWLFHAC